MPLPLATSVGVFAVSALLTGLLCRYLTSQDVLDVPNSRSSHATSTPRGGATAALVRRLLKVSGCTTRTAAMRINGWLVAGGIAR